MMVDVNRDDELRLMLDGYQQVQQASRASDVKHLLSVQPLGRNLVKTVIIPLLSYLQLKRLVLVPESVTFDVPL